MPVMTKTGKKLLQSVCAHWESALEKEELIQLTAIGTFLFCPKVGLAGILLRVCQERRICRLVRWSAAWRHRNEI